MEPGTWVIAKWADGLVLTGSYEKTNRGYIILKSESGEQIVCNKDHVRFEILKNNKQER